MGFWSSLKDGLKLAGKTIKTVVAVPVGIGTGMLGAVFGVVVGGVHGAKKGNTLKGIKSGFLEGDSLGVSVFDKISGREQASIAS